jgi:hypothetical protein
MASMKERTAATGGRGVVRGIAGRMSEGGPGVQAGLEAGEKVAGIGMLSAERDPMRARIR